MGGDERVGWVRVAVQKYFARIAQPHAVVRSLIIDGLCVDSFAWSGRLVDVYFWVSKIPAI
jgi:hypothetical protein